PLGQRGIVSRAAAARAFIARMRGGPVRRPRCRAARTAPKLVPPALPRSGHSRKMSGACGQLDLDRRCGPVRLDGLDRGIATRRRSIHLARTDHLVVGGLEVEELLAVRRRLLLVTIVELTVLLNRRDP